MTMFRLIAMLILAIELSIKYATMPTVSLMSRLAIKKIRSL